MVAAFGGSEDEGGDARASSLGPRSPIGVGDRLRGDDGWVGVTILVCQAAPGAIFRGMTLGRCACSGIWALTARLVANVAAVLIEVHSTD